MGDLSPVSVKRLSLYLRCLRELRAEGVRFFSSAGLAERCRLNAHQIRKDLAQLGELGVRGVGYEVEKLFARLSSLFGLDDEHRVIILGVGNLGTALARFPGFQRDGVRIVGLVDADPAKIGTAIGALEIRPPSDLAPLAQASSASIGVLAVPAASAQACYLDLVACGLDAVLNFAPIHLEPVDAVPVKNVDLRFALEELAFLAAAEKGVGTGR